MYHWNHMSVDPIADENTYAFKVAAVPSVLRVCIHDVSLSLWNWFDSKWARLFKFQPCEMLIIILPFYIPTLF